MTTLVSVQSTQFVTIATAPVPSASVLQQSTETVSVRSDDGVTVVESPSPALTVKSEANSVLLNIETTSTVVLSVNTGALPPPDINRRIGEDLAAQVNGVTSTFTTAVEAPRNSSNCANTSLSTSSSTEFFWLLLGDELPF